MGWGRSSFPLHYQAERAENLGPNLSLRRDKFIALSLFDAYARDRMYLSLMERIDELTGLGRAR